MDFREGGRYIFAMKGPNGVTKWSGGEYQYIVKYKKIVCTDRFMSKDGRVLTAQEFGFSGDWPRTLFIVVDFDRIGDCTTKINISHRGVPELMHENCIQGWNSTLNKLQKLVEKNGSSTSHIAT